MMSSKIVPDSAGTLILDDRLESTGRPIGPSTTSATRPGKSVRLGDVGYVDKYGQFHAVLTFHPDVHYDHQTTEPHPTFTSNKQNTLIRDRRTASQTPASKGGFSGLQKCGPMLIVGVVIDATID